MITSTQAQQYLDQALGVSVPVFIVEAAVAKVSTAEPAMVAAGYSVMDQILIQSMAIAIAIAIAIVASAGAPRRIASQGAASGASRSFKNFDASLTALRRSLAALDTASTVADLIGIDPASNTMLMVVC